MKTILWLKAHVSFKKIWDTIVAVITINFCIVLMSGCVSTPAMKELIKGEINSTFGVNNSELLKDFFKWYQDNKQTAGRDINKVTNWNLNVKLPQKPK